MKETMQSESLTSKMCVPFWGMTRSKKTPIKVSRESIKAMIIDANDSYCDEFRKGNKLKAMWWDGYLEALHRVMDYYEK